MTYSEQHIQRAKRFRLAAFACFFMSGAAFMVVLVPAMFSGQGRVALVSLVVSLVLFTLAFLFASIGWAEFDETETSYYPKEHAAQHPEDLVLPERKREESHPPP